MRDIKAKRIFRLTVCLILAFSLFAAVACGGKKTPGENNDPAETTYTVTFDTQGGSEIDPISVSAGTYAEKPDNPTKAGHIFKGWVLDLSDTESGYFMFPDTPITSNITLYAVWQIRQYNVSYQDPDGNALDIGGGVYDWGSLIPEPEDSAYEKTGYILKWFTSNGDVWDFDTSTVISNTVLTYRYVTSKDTFTAADVYEDFYPVYNKTITDAESCSGEWLEDSQTALYTYAGQNLQQIVVNIELSTLKYDSVTVVARSTDKDGDYEKGGTFSQLRAYIKTDAGGNVSYNDEPSSGYNPLYYYIQSTGTNLSLFSSSTDADGWTSFTFDLASLKFWNEGTRLDAFAFGFVSTTLGIEIKSIKFNEVDPDQTFTVSFADSLGNQLASAQTVKWNTYASKPAAPTDTDTLRYTGEWLDGEGSVFDFDSTPVRKNVTLTPEYSIVGKYSWTTGEEIARDFKAVYNASRANLANQLVFDRNAMFTYNNGAAGNSLEQIAIDNLNLEIGEYRYLTVNMRTNTYVY